jgi:hemerythrin
MQRWQQQMTLGVEELDEQHREIFRRAQLADEALSSGRSSAVTAELVGFLIDYCQQHFDSELRLMESQGYPASAPHSLQHAWFSETVREVREDLAEGAPDDEIARRLNDLLLRWLVNHIATFDCAFASWARGPAAAARQAE